MIGVIQIVNKKKGTCFTKSDETLFQTFSVYCGFVLSYARLYDKMSYMVNYLINNEDFFYFVLLLFQNNMNEVYKEMLALHMQPCIHDFNFTINHPDVTLPPRFNQ